MPYNVTAGLAAEEIPQAKEIASSIISYMHSQVAEQTGAGVHHPYASGTFAIEHFREGEVFVALLAFYPSSLGSGSEAGPERVKKVVEKGKSGEGFVDALLTLRHYVDPTSLTCRHERW